ncbi:AAA family ATPase [Spirosoma aerolatum]|uniref:AAA family ATPase n=1 Tax=Spirosoma aerolatum TaxID=1211326 RepID=UPI0009AE2B85|nr:AAA family ATPase [Spirosoma aerolatum]
MANEQNITSVYFRSLSLRDIKCFKGDSLIKLSNRQGEPSLWTVLLGNNNTGKTTAIKIFAALSYPEILAEYLSKYNLKKYSSLLRRNGNFNFNTQVFYNWLSNSQNRPMIGPNLFFPFFDYSLYIKRIKERIDLNSFDLKKNIAVTDYILNSLLNYQNNLTIYAYGIQRRISDISLSEASHVHPTANLFESAELLNVEEWILQTDYATKIGNEINRKKAKTQFARIKHLIVDSQILPDIKNIRINSSEDLQSYVEVNVSQSWVKLKDLGYGYQATMAWVTDLAKRMFDRYPDLENPLHGPAIVLVDEIDLHLHPEWQRKIIKYLSDLFPNTQFIVTAHSPLIVQSAENVNLIMLEKDDETGSINIRQQFGSFQGWTVEEILRELMDMGEKTRSDRYLELMRQFEDGLLAEDYNIVKTAYDELDKILSPSSHQRKVLQIQMSSLIPV